MWQAGVVMRLRGGAAAHQQIVGRASLVLCRRCTLHHRTLLGERRATTAVVATSTALVARRRHGRGCAALRRATIFHRSAIFRRSAALRRSAVRRLHRRNALRRAAFLLLHVDRLACTARRAPTRGSAQLVLVMFATNSLASKA